MLCPANMLGYAPAIRLDDRVERTCGEAACRRCLPLGLAGGLLFASDCQAA